MKWFGYIALASSPLTFAAETLETLVVTGHRDLQSSAELIGSIGVVGEASLVTVAHTHISEALARVPGTWISRGNGQEHLTAIRSPVLTGAGSCGEFQMAEDSIPLRATGFCNVNQLFEANTEQADSIEVWRGPGSVFYGSNALHGVVNVLSAAPRDRASISIEAGPNDYYRSKLALGQKGVEHSWQLGINSTSDGGFKDSSGFDQQKLSFKLESKFGDWLSVNTISATNLNQETAGFVQGKYAYRDSVLRESNPNPEAFRDASSLRITSRWERQMSPQSKITLTPYMRQSEMKFLQHYLPGQAQENNEHKSVGLQAVYESSPFSDATLWLGADLESASGDLLEFQNNDTDSSSAFLRASIPSGQHYDYSVDSEMGALFANLEFRPAENLLVDVGLRYEHLVYDYDNRMISGDTKDNGELCVIFGNPRGCRFVRPDDREDNFNNISYQIGALWNLGREARVFVRLAEAYRAPQATELYRLQKGQELASLDSESLTSFELGVRGLVGRASYELSLFNMEKDDFIFRDSDGYNINGGKTDHRGVELSMQYAISESLTYSMASSWAEHTYANNPALVGSPISGNDIDTAPRLNHSARLNWAPNSRYSSELEWVYLGDYYLDPQNEHEYAGHSLLNARVTGRIGDGVWQVSARISNLLDRRYADRADFAFGNYRYFTGQSRAVHIEIQRNFSL